MGRLLTAGTILQNKPLGCRNDSRKEATGIKRAQPASLPVEAVQPIHRPDVDKLLDSIRKRGG